MIADPGIAMTAARRAPPTNEDTIGPYYPIPFLDADRMDLTRVHPGLGVGPQGRPVTLRGRVLDRLGAPASGALLEFQQANAAGLPPGPDAAGDPRFAPPFEGVARCRTTDGRFALRTILPGAVAGRAPHVALAVFSDGITRLATQIFFADEPGNDADPLLAALPADRRARLVARRASGERDAYEIDVVLAGEGETPFFDDLAEGGGERLLAIGPTDNTSDQRTPRERLRAIPPVTRRSFVPWLATLPGLRAGEDDLTRIAPGRPRAAGEPIEITGRVVDADGRPPRRVLIEIWVANTHGRYTHAEDRSDLRIDPHHLGLGRVLTDDAGAYRFRTIKPGAYLARPDIGRWRPSHVHLSLRGGATRLVTQMYFAGDRYNAGDPMAIVMGDAFARNVGVAAPTHAADVSRAFRFDIVVGGRNATFFA